MHKIPALIESSLRRGSGDSGRAQAEISASIAGRTEVRVVRDKSPAPVSALADLGFFLHSKAESHTHSKCRKSTGQICFVKYLPVPDSYTTIALFDGDPLLQ